MLSKGDWINQVNKHAGVSSATVKGEMDAAQSHAHELYMKLWSEARSDVMTVMKTIPGAGATVKPLFTAAVESANGKDFVSALDSLKKAVWAAKDAKEHGFKLVSKGAEYDGEDVRKGWRASDPSDRDSTRTVTRYDRTPEEQAKSRAEASDLGQLVDMNGVPIDGELGYVIDPQTGNMHTFHEAKIERTFQDGTKAETIGNRMTPELAELIRVHGNLVQSRMPHHTSPLAGAQVAGAGGIKMKDGYIRSIDNVSGHYKPDEDATFRSIRHLDEQGVLIDKSVVDRTGTRLVADGERTAEEQKLEAALRKDPERIALLDEKIAELERKGKTSSDQYRKAVAKRDELRLAEQRIAEDLEIAQAQGRAITQLELQIAEWDTQGRKHDDEYQRAVDELKVLHADLEREGYAIRNAEAVVGVFQNITPEEWAPIAGKPSAIADFVNTKYGLKGDKMITSLDFVGMENNLGAVTKIVATNATVKTRKSVYLAAHGDLARVKEREILAAQLEDTVHKQGKAEYEELGGVQQLVELGFLPYQVSSIPMEDRVQILRGQITVEDYHKAQESRMTAEIEGRGGRSAIAALDFTEEMIDEMTTEEKLELLQREVDPDDLRDDLEHRLHKPPANAGVYTTNEEFN
jgi:urease gamma subunit